MLADLAGHPRIDASFRMLQDGVLDEAGEVRPAAI